MKKLYLMKLLSRVSGYRIDVCNTKRRSYFFLRSSKTGEKYRPWLGVVATFGMLVAVLVMIVSAIGIFAVLENYGFGHWPVSVVLAVFVFLSWKALKVLRNLFVTRPDLNEGYKYTYEDLDTWVQ